MYFWNCIQVKYNPKSAKLALLVKYPLYKQEVCHTKLRTFEKCIDVMGCLQRLFYRKDPREKVQVYGHFESCVHSTLGKILFFFSFRSGNFSSFGKKKEIKTRYILLQKVTRRYSKIFCSKSCTTLHYHACYKERIFEYQGRHKEALIWW